jgi:hypothetical protein
MQGSVQDDDDRKPGLCKGHKLVFVSSKYGIQGVDSNGSIDTTEVEIVVLLDKPCSAIRQSRARCGSLSMKLTSHVYEVIKFNSRGRIFNQRLTFVLARLTET